MTGHFVTLCLLSLTLWNIHDTTARQLGRDENVLFKRNAWWSKKSAGFAVPNELGDDDSGEKPTLGSLIGCYAEECVPDLLLCGNQAGSEQGYIQCKLQHRICASKCFHGIL